MSYPFFLSAWQMAQRLNAGGPRTSKQWRPVRASLWSWEVHYGPM